MTVRVGHLAIRVFPWEDSAADVQEADGLYVPGLDVIYIRRTRPGPEQLRVLLHELLHAIWDAFRFEDRPLSEEEVCSKFDFALVNVFQANPWLADLIKEHLEPGGPGFL